MAYLMDELSFPVHSKTSNFGKVYTILFAILNFQMTFYLNSHFDNLKFEV